MIKGILALICGLASVGLLSLPVQAVGFASTISSTTGGGVCLAAIATLSNSLQTFQSIAGSFVRGNVPSSVVTSIQNLIAAIQRVILSLGGCIGSQSLSSEPNAPPGAAVSTSSTLAISLDPNMPGRSLSVDPGGRGYAFVLADLNAGSSAVDVNSLNFGCGGYACSSITNLRMIGAGPDDNTWYASPANPYSFTPNLVIPAGAREVVSFVGDISPSAPIGQEIQGSLTSDSVDIAGGGPVTGSAFGNVLTVAASSSRQSVSLQINGSTGPLTASPGVPLNLVWNSTGIPVTCTVSFNPTGAGYTNIAEGLSGGTTVSLPAVSTQTAFVYEVSCPVSGTGGPAVAASVEVTVLPISQPVSLTINGAHNGGFALTEPWTLAITSNVPDAAVTLCAIDNHGVQSCTPGFGSTDANGDWSLNGSFASSEVGTWQEWAELGPNQAISSNHIYFGVE